MAPKLKPSGSFCPKEIPKPRNPKKNHPKKITQRNPKKNPPKKSKKKSPKEIQKKITQRNPKKNHPKRSPKNHPSHPISHLSQPAELLLSHSRASPLTRRFQGTLPLTLLLGVARCLKTRKKTRRLGAEEGNLQFMMLLRMIFLGGCGILCL